MTCYPSITVCGRSRKSARVSGPSSQAVQTGLDIKDMSAELKRTRASIRARLEKLGLTSVEIGHEVP